MYIRLLKIEGCSVVFRLLIQSDFLLSSIDCAFSIFYGEDFHLNSTQLKLITIYSKEDRTYILLNDVFYLSCEKDNTEIVLSAIIDIISESFDCFPVGYSFFHAYVIAKGNEATLLIAATHNGKTTLGTALTLTGYTYLSDDVAIFNEKGQLIPFPLPIKLRKNDLLCKSKLSKKYHIISTNNYDFLIPYKNISGLFTPQKIIFLKRINENECFTRKVHIDRFEALQRLIWNASYCKDILAHSLASKRIIQKSESIVEITYGSGLKVLDLI